MHHLAALLVEQRIGEADAIGLDEQPIGRLVRGADHGQMHRVGHLEAEPAADVEDDVAEHRLGVEQAVHVEDDGGEGRERQGCAAGSMAGDIGPFAGIASTRARHGYLSLTLPP